MAEPLTGPALVRSVRAHFRGDPARWTQGVLEKDFLGRTGPATSLPSVCWCLAGAALEVGGKGADARLATALGFVSVNAMEFFNDHHERVWADVDALLASVEGRATA